MPLSFFIGFLILIIMIAFYARMLFRSRDPYGRVPGFNPPASSSIARGTLMYSRGFLGLGARREFRY